MKTDEVVKPLINTENFDLASFTIETRFCVLTNFSNGNHLLTLELVKAGIDFSTIGFQDGANVEMGECKVGGPDTLTNFKTNLNCKVVIFNIDHTTNTEGLDITSTDVLVIMPIFGYALKYVQAIGRINRLCDHNRNRRLIYTLYNQLERDEFIYNYNELKTDSDKYQALSTLSFDDKFSSNTTFQETIYKKVSATSELPFLVVDQKIQQQ